MSDWNKGIIEGLKIAQVFVKREWSDAVVHSKYEQQEILEYMILQISDHIKAEKNHIRLQELNHD